MNAVSAAFILKTLLFSMVALRQVAPAGGLVPATFSRGVSCLTRPVWLHGLTDNYVFTLLQVFSVFRHFVKMLFKNVASAFFYY
jgi:hypothetical protein